MQLKGLDTWLQPDPPQAKKCQNKGDSMLNYATSVYSSVSVLKMMELRAGAVFFPSSICFPMMQEQTDNLATQQYTISISIMI